MRLDPKVIAASSERISGKLAAPIIFKPIALPVQPERWARIENYTNARRQPDDPFALERAMGTNDLLGVSYFWNGLRAARAVGRIEIAPGPGDRGGSATGFMVAPDVLLTNWHVFKSQEIAARSRVQFGYEVDENGHERPTTWFSFATARLFVSVEALDYCFVAVDAASKNGPDALPTFGWLRLNPQLGKADYGQFLSLVQHPGKEVKQISIRENKLYPFKDADLYLTYQSDTFRGSSGSPVFNDHWDVVALHHSGKAERDAQGRYIGHDNKPILDPEPEEHEVKWIANEGFESAVSSMTFGSAASSARIAKR